MFFEATSYFKKWYNQRMLDPKFILKNPELVKEGCKKKGEEEGLVDEFLKWEKKRRKVLKEVEGLRKEQNEMSKQIAISKKKEFLEKAKEIKKELEKKEKVLKNLEKKTKEILSQIPNLPLPDVPEGKDDSQNVVVKVWGKIPQFDFKVKDHLEIGEKLDLIDVKRAAKTSGSRFGFLKNELVLLELALLQFATEEIQKENFQLILPPVLIKPELFWGMGYLEKGREDIYFLEKDNLFLVGTAEQILGPMHANEIFKEKELPKRYLAFSACFRREAGSWGKDTRGIFRVHQFDKLEMFSFCQPEASVKEHDFFLSLEERLVQKLKLPYRVVKVCSGEMAFPTARQFDIEIWFPGQGRWRETHSTSNCTDFQARRLNIRYFNEKTKKLEFVHTVNGTAFAMGRMICAILENYQKKDGSVLVPEVLKKYLPFDKIPCR